ANSRRGRKRRPPDMPDDDLRFRQQRGKMLRIALIIEDRGFQRGLDLGENARRDASGEMAEKQGFHVLPSPTHDGRAIVAVQLAPAKGLEVAGRVWAARGRSEGCAALPAPSRSHGRPRPEYRRG